jgi:hypothetical protein
MKSAVCRLRGCAPRHGSHRRGRCSRRAWEVSGWRRDGGSPRRFVIGGLLHTGRGRREGPQHDPVHKHGIRGEPDPYAEEPQRAPGDPARDWRASRNHRDPDEYERQLTSNLEPLAARRVGVDRESRSRRDRSCGGTDAQGGRRKGTVDLRQKNRSSETGTKGTPMRSQGHQAGAWTRQSSLSSEVLRPSTMSGIIQWARSIPPGGARTQLSCHVTLRPDERRCQPTAWRDRRVTSPAPPAVGADAFTSTPPGVTRANGSPRYPRMIAVWPGATVRRTARSLS